MDSYNKKDVIGNNHNQLFSNAIRAGRRTYFFDVKVTKNDDYYLTVTESKKLYDDNGNTSFEKHKIFLYKEDFEKFADGLSDAIQFIKGRQEGNLKENDENFSVEEGVELGTKSFSDIEFEDLSY